MQADDPKKVKEARTRAKHDAERRAEYTRFVMSTPQGRAWMWDFLAEANVFQTPFSQDPLLMAHNVGMQNQGRKLLAELMELTPTEFMTMLKEAQDDRHARDELDKRNDDQRELNFDVAGLVE